MAVMTGQPTVGQGLGRGIRRRCGRCGEPHVFDGWFQMKERCPRCGYRFAREAGHFTGTYLLNFAVTESLMFLVLLGYALWRGITGTHAPIWPFAAGCAVFAVLAPVIFYPFATSTWAAIDLLMRPLDELEELDAGAHAAD
jgi:uncharacterized protein (DUF983 family)